MTQKIGRLIRKLDLIKHGDWTSVMLIAIIVIFLALILAIAR